VLPDPANNEVINFIKTAVGPEDANQVRDTANAVTFDPTNSERKYYRDAFTGKQREVWRPGTLHLQYVNSLLVNPLTM